MRQTLEIVVVTTAALLFSALSWMSLPPLIPPIRDEFSLSYAEAGFLASASVFLAAPLLLVSGFLSDRFESRKLVAVFIAALFVPTFLSGFARSYEDLFLLRFFAGISVGVFPAGFKLLVGRLSPDRTGAGIGVYAAGFSAGIGIAAFLAPFFASYAGWRLAFELVSIPLIPMALFFWFRVKDGTRQADPKARPNAARLVLNRRLWLMAFLDMGVFGNFIAFSAWLPTYLVARFDYPLTLAGSLVAISFVTGAIVRPLGGHIADRHGWRFTVVWSQVVLLVLLLVSAFTQSSSVAVTASLLVALVSLFGAGAYFVLPSRLFGNDISTAVGITGLVTITVDGILLPPVIGAFVDSTGSFSLGFMILAVLAGLGTISSLTLRRFVS